MASLHPTREDEQGWHINHPNTRNRLNAYGSSIRNGQLGKRTSTRALTKVKVTKPDTLVNLRRRRPLRAHLTVYIDVADRAGLNAQNVANLYRTRADAGLAPITTEVEVVTTDTWGRKG